MKLLESVGNFLLCDLLVLISAKDHKMAIINTADKRDSHKIFEKFKTLIHGPWTSMTMSGSSMKAVKASLANANMDNRQLVAAMQEVVDDYAPIGQYIRQVRETVLKKRDANEKRPSYLLVVGNESCDLDSVISAIALAYFLSEMAHDELRKHVLGLGVDEVVIVVPLLQIENGDMVLKSESLFYMRANRLDLETVLTM